MNIKGDTKETNDGTTALAEGWKGWHVLSEEQKELLRIADSTLDMGQRLLTEAHWLIEYARCQGEYGLGEEWNRRYEAWKKEVGV